MRDGMNGSLSEHTPRWDDGRPWNGSPVPPRPTPPGPQGRKPEPATPNLSWRTFRNAVYRSPGLATATVSVAILAGVAIWMFLPLPKMTAYAVFQIQSTPPSILNPVERIEPSLIRQAEAALVKSQMVLRAAAKHPALDGVSLFPAGSSSERVSILDNLLKVDFRPGPEFMRISVEGDNGEELLAIIRAVCGAYLENGVNRDKIQMQGRLSALRDAEKVLDQDAQTLARAMARELGTNNPQDMVDRRRYAEERRSHLRQRLITLEEDIRDAQIEAEFLAREEGTTEELPEEILFEALRNDPEAVELLNRIAKLKADIANAERRFTDARKAEVIPRFKKELAIEEERLKPLKDRKLGQLQAMFGKQSERQRAIDLNKAKNRLNSSKLKKAEIEKELRLMNQNELKADPEFQGLDELRTKHKQKQDMLAMVRQKITAMEVESGAPERVTQLEPPTASPGIEGNRRLKYSIMAAFGVLVCGFGLIMFGEVRNPRVQDTNQIMNTLGLRVIGAIPRLPHGNKSFLNPAPTTGTARVDSRFLANEAADATRNLLLYGVAGGDKPAKTILVASPMSGEGKSSLSALLAISLARFGARTLLVDCDLRKPSMHRLFELGEAHHGLTDVLIDTTLDWQQFVMATGQPELSLLPAGDWDPEVVRALKGDRWPQLVEQMGQMYDFVVIDSSPILPVSDTLLFARAVDGVLVSALQDVSELGSLRTAVTQLEQVGATVFGVVFHGTDNPFYYQGYYQGYYYHNRPAVATRRNLPRQLSGPPSTVSPRPAVVTPFVPPPPTPPVADVTEVVNHVNHVNHVPNAPTTSDATDVIELRTTEYDDESALTPDNPDEPSVKPAGGHG